jgi:hypothetical protein
VLEIPFVPFAVECVGRELPLVRGFPFPFDAPLVFEPEPEACEAYAAAKITHSFLCFFQCLVWQPREQ